MHTEAFNQRQLFSQLSTASRSSSLSIVVDLVLLSSSSGGSVEFQLESRKIREPPSELLERLEIR